MSIDLGRLKIIHDNQKYLYLKSKDNYVKLDKEYDYYYIDKYKIDISGTKEVKIDEKWYDKLHHANFIQDEDKTIIEIDDKEKANTI